MSASERKVFFRNINLSTAYKFLQIANFVTPSPQQYNNIYTHKHIRKNQHSTDINLSLSMAILVGRDSVSVRVLCIILFLMMMMIGCVSSDWTEDKKECQDKLIGLSPCLAFVSGDSKAPTPECCVELRKDISNTRKCLCMLVKDRNEPGLGFKINATLALSLPSICHAPANVSDCPALLHLPPNSTDAQVFQQFSSTSKGSDTTAGDNHTGSSTTLRGRRWLGLPMAGGISLWLLISLFITGV